LLFSINDHVKNEEHFEKFEIERNALPTIGMPMLNIRLFGQIDAIIKDFLTPIMLGKQRSQMNQSVCYDVNRVTEWQQLMEGSKFNVRPKLINCSLGIDSSHNLIPLFL